MTNDESRELRVQAIAHGLQQCRDRDPDSLDRMLAYHAQHGRFASEACVIDAEGLVCPMRAGLSKLPDTALKTASAWGSDFKLNPHYRAQDGQRMSFGRALEQRESDDEILDAIHLLKQENE